MTSSTSKVTLAQRLRGLIAGTQKHPPSGSLTFGGVAHTEAELVQTFQSLIDELSKVDAARGGWKDAVKNMRDLRAKVGPIVRAYRSWLVSTHGNAPALLSDYGIELQARMSPDASTTATAVAKRAATRKERHTMGKRQKAGIKGTVATNAPAPATTAPAPRPRLRRRRPRRRSWRDSQHTATQPPGFRPQRREPGGFFWPSIVTPRTSLTW